MIKLINVVAGLVVALTFATEVSAGDIKHSAPSESGVQASTGSGKDMAGMDALVQSLQTGGRVKVGLSATPRSRSGDFAFGSSVSADSGAEIFDEAPEMDGRMLIAGLILVFVIALRRIRR